MRILKALSLSIVAWIAVRGDDVTQLFDRMDGASGLMRVKRAPVDSTPIVALFPARYTEELLELISSFNSTFSAIEDKFVYDGSGGSIVHESNHTLNYMTMVCGSECDSDDDTAQDVKDDLPAIVYKLQRCVKNKLRLCKVFGDHLYAEYYAGINTVYDVDAAADKARASVNSKVKAKLNTTDIDTPYDDADWNVAD